MKAFPLTLPLLVSAALLAGCGSSITQPVPSGWQAEIRGEAEFAMLTGTIGVASQFGATVAAIQIQGPASTAFTWRLVTGSCTTPGTGVGPVASYPQLLTSNQGRANAQADLNQMLNPDGRYAVVLRTTDGAIAACGNLDRQVFSSVDPVFADSEAYPGASAATSGEFS